MLMPITWCKILTESSDAYEATYRDAMLAPVSDWVKLRTGSWPDFDQSYRTVANRETAGLPFFTGK